MFFSKRQRKKASSVNKSPASQKQKAGALQATNELAGFRYMFERGIALSDKNTFSTTLEFSDIPYEHERKDVKLDIFDKFASLHTLFSAKYTYQINLMNLPKADNTDTAALRFEEIGPDKELAEAYNDILKQRAREGRCDFVRKNLLTISCAAEDLDAAEASLASLKESVNKQFSRLGSRVTSLTGRERALLIRDLLDGGGAPDIDYEKFRKTKKDHIRDLVCPAWAAYDEKDRLLKRYLRFPHRFVKTFHIRDFGSDVSDRTLRSIRTLPIAMNISLLFCPQDKAKVVKQVSQNIDIIQAETHDYVKSIRKGGGDATLLPPALERKEREAKELLDFIRDEDQHIAFFQGFITIYADTVQDLTHASSILLEEAAIWSVDVVELPVMQEEALISALPLACSRLDKKFRSLTTSESAILIPFASQNINDSSLNSYLLGVDAVSRQPIRIDSDQCKSPHMWVFGGTGSGKSMQINSLLTAAFLQYPRSVYDTKRKVYRPKDINCPQWHVVDFHAEYVDLFKRIGGTISHFGPNYQSCLNPISLSSEKDKLTETAIRDNADFFYALFENLVSRPLERREMSILDRCLQTTYQPYIGTHKRPTLTDLYKNLKKDNHSIAQGFAEDLEIFVVGSMDAFAHETNVKSNPQANLYVMNELGYTMETLALLSVLQHVRNCTYRNFKLGRSTYLVLEEVQILFSNAAAIRTLDSYFSEMRKYGLHIICVTQLINRVLAHSEAVNLFENSGIFVVLPLQPKNVQTVRDEFKLSATQTDLISQSAEAGTGLVLVDDIKIAMVNRIPKGNLLYKIWNTDPDRGRGRREKSK